jgi:cytidylate kinase
MHYFMDRLVNKAIQNSQVKRVEKLKLRVWSPDIVISRDPGSGGRVVAQKIAKRLGWQLFDRSFIRELSIKLGIPEDEVADVDEHGRNWITDFVHSILNPDYVSDVRYIAQLKKLLNHASKKSDLVILGHGANVILPPDKCLRVRITASRDTRVSNTYKFEGKETKEEAALCVEKVEKKYSQFIRQYFGVNPHNPWNYDLVISTDHLTLDQATDLVIQAYLAKFPSEKKKLKSKLV